MYKSNVNAERVLDHHSRARAVADLFARTRSYVSRFYSIFVLLGLWQLTAVIIDNQLFLPRLSAVLETIWVNLLSGQLEADIEASLFRCLAGFGLALVFGTALGIMMGWSQKWDNFWNFAISFTKSNSKAGTDPAFYSLARNRRGVEDCSDFYGGGISNTYQHLQRRERREQVVALAGDDIRCQSSRNPLEGGACRGASTHFDWCEIGYGGRVDRAPRCRDGRC